MKFFLYFIKKKLKKNFLFKKNMKIKFNNLKKKYGYI